MLGSLARSYSFPTGSGPGTLSYHVCLMKIRTGRVGLTDQLAWWRVVSIYEAEPSVCRHNPTIPHLKHNVRKAGLSKEILADSGYNQSHLDFRYWPLFKPDLLFTTLWRRQKTSAMIKWVNGPRRRGRISHHSISTTLTQSVAYLVAFHLEMWRVASFGDLSRPKFGKLFAP